MRVFRPNLNILPLAQQRLWPQLKNASRMGFVLYGGTAIALRLGHRDSIDFDFFSAQPLNREAIKATFPFVSCATTLQDHNNTWVMLGNVINGQNKEVQSGAQPTFGSTTIEKLGLRINQKLVSPAHHFLYLPRCINVDVQTTRPVVGRHGRSRTQYTCTAG